MATSKVPLSIVPAQPVPAKKSPVPDISQDQLRWIVYCENEVAKLRVLETQLVQAKAEVRALLEANAGIQPGPWTTYLGTVNTNHPDLQKPFPVRPGVIQMGLASPTLATRVVVERSGE